MKRLGIWDEGTPCFSEKEGELKGKDGVGPTVKNEYETERLNEREMRAGK